MNAMKVSPEKIAILFSDVNKPFTSMCLPLIMENPINNALAMSGDVKNGFTSKSADGLNLSHSQSPYASMYIRHSYSLPTSPAVLRLPIQTPLGLRVIHGLTGAIFRIIGMGSQWRNGDIHPDMKG
jgi:hypothetical protein